MTFEECKKEVAKKHGLGKTLVTGHLSKYWEEAAEIYANQLVVKNEKQKDHALEFGKFVMQNAEADVNDGSVFISYGLDTDLTVDQLYEIFKNKNNLI